MSPHDVTVRNSKYYMHEHEGVIYICFLLLLVLLVASGNPIALNKGYIKQCYRGVRYTAKSCGLEACGGRRSPQATAEWMIPWEF